MTYTFKLNNQYEIFYHSSDKKEKRQQINEVKTLNQKTFDDFYQNHLANKSYAWCVKLDLLIEVFEKYQWQKLTSYNLKDVIAKYNIYLQQLVLFKDSKLENPNSGNQNFNLSSFIDPNFKDIHEVLDYHIYVLTYSWAEVLYDLLLKMKEDRILAENEKYVWVDIICVDQTKDPAEALSNLPQIYKKSSSYCVSSFDAFHRYWCCFELSIKKSNEKIHLLIDNVTSGFSDKVIELFLEYMEEIAEWNHHQLKFLNTAMDFSNFDIHNAKITLEKDKEFIEGIIKKRIS